MEIAALPEVSLRPRSAGAQASLRRRAARGLAPPARRSALCALCAPPRSMTSELRALGGQDGAGLAGAVGEWVWRSNRAWLSLLGPRQRLPAFNTRSSSSSTRSQATSLRRPLCQTRSQPRLPADARAP